MLAEAHPCQCTEQVLWTRVWAVDCVATSRVAPWTCSYWVVLASPNHSPPGKQFSEDRGSQTCSQHIRQTLCSPTRILAP